MLIHWLNKYLSFFFIPILILIFLQSIQHIFQPFYLCFNFDPSYAYLFNSLNIAKALPVYHFDHPGTPAQLIGAIVIHITHLFYEPSVPIDTSVVKNPEFYIQIICAFFQLIFVTCLTFMSLFLRKSGFQKSFIIFCQLGTFLIAWATVESLEKFSSESFLVSISIIFSFVLVYEYEKKRFFKNNILLIAIISGLGIATKILFTPLLILPVLLIKQYRQKIKFLIYTMLTFFIITLPGLPRYPYFFSWILKLFLGTGNYGKGEKTIINLPDYLHNISLILKEHLLFCITFIALLIFFLYSNKKIFQNFNLKKITNNQKFITGTLIAIGFQLLIVGKHYNERYILSSLILLIIFLPSLIKFFKKEGVSLNPYVLSTIAALFIVVRCIYFYYHYQEIDKKNTESLKLVKYRKKHHKELPVIFHYRSSSLYTSLSHGNYYAGHAPKKHKEKKEDPKPIENWIKNTFMKAAKWYYSPDSVPFERVNYGIFYKDNRYYPLFKKQFPHCYALKYYNDINVYEFIQRNQLTSVQPLLRRYNKILFQWKKNQKTIPKKFKLKKVYEGEYENLYIYQSGKTQNQNL